MQWVFIAMVIVAGMLNTIQSGMNGTLQKTLQQPLWAFVVISAVGLTTATVALIASGQRLPTAQAILDVPWWGWVGGIPGAFYVLAMIVAVDKVGAAIFTGITVTTAILGSLVMDHLGLLGFDVHPAGIARIAGGLLMVAGVSLIAAF